MTEPTDRDRKEATAAFNSFLNAGGVAEGMKALRRPVMAALVAATALGAAVPASGSQLDFDVTPSVKPAEVQRAVSRDTFDVTPPMKPSKAALLGDPAGAPGTGSPAPGWTYEAWSGEERAHPTPTMSAWESLGRSDLGVALEKEVYSWPPPRIEGFPHELELFAREMDDVIADHRQAQAVARFADLALAEGWTVKEALDALDRHKENIALPGWNLLGYYETPARERAKADFDETFTDAWRALAEIHPGEAPGQSSPEHTLVRGAGMWKLVDVQGRIDNPYGPAVRTTERDIYALDGETMSFAAMRDALKERRAEEFAERAVEASANLDESQKPHLRELAEDAIEFDVARNGYGGMRWIESELPDGSVVSLRLDLPEGPGDSGGGPPEEVADAGPSPR